MKKLFAILISSALLLSMLASCNPQKPENIGSDVASDNSVQSEFLTEETNSDFDIVTSQDKDEENKDKDSEIDKDTSSKTQNKPTSSDKSPDKTSSKDKTSSQKPTSSKNETVSLPSAPSLPSITPSGDEFKEINPIGPEDFYGWKYLKAKGTEGEQKAYKAFQKAFSQYERTVNFDFKLTANEANRAYEVYMEDHPEEFFLGKASYTMDQNKNVIKFTLKSSAMELSTAEIAKLENQVLDKVNKIVVKLFPNGVYKNEIETVRVVHDYLINNIKYDVTHEAEHSHDMYGALINGRSVCEGYAESFMHIMRLCGIECFMVNGVLHGVNHVWNMVKLDGSWYHIDVTSDDPILSSGEQVLRFDYFNLTESEIKKTHTIQDNIVDIPKATATKYNFYKYYGLEFSSINNNAFINSISFSMKNGYDCAYFKFTKNTPSEAVKYYLNNGGAIAAAVNNNRLGKKIIFAGKVSYSQNKDKNILNLDLKYA